MYLLGCRVVRGPDWTWDDQDGGEGGVGTIVSTDTFSDGSPLKNQTVLVCWDTGKEADYRLGLDEKCDLRILDSAPSGVCFEKVICHGCSQNPLLGTRWKCTDWDDYDLCTQCYNNEVHYLVHSFERHDHCELKSKPVGQRSSSVKVQAKGIFPGSKVINGRDSEDDVGSMTGIVIMDHHMNDDIPRGKVLVEWGGQSAINIEHRLGFDGKVDLKLERSVPDIYYYMDHLMIPRILVRTDERFQVKDKVTVHLDLDDLHQIIKAKYDGHWDADMERGITEEGIVEYIDENGVEVKFKTLEETLLFPHECLSKIHDLRVKDRVAISGYKEKVKILQEGHRGWIDQMEKVLGQEGTVTEIDEKGDARVQVGEVKWWFNPAVLILESKEEEREPAGTAMTDDAKDDAGEDESAALTVVRESSKKSLKEELLEDLPEVLATGKEVAKEVMSKMTEGLEKLCDNARKKLIVKDITSSTDKEPVEYFGILFTDRYFDDLPEDIFYSMIRYFDDKDTQWIGEGPWKPEKFLRKFPKEGYERKDCLQYLFEVLGENFPAASYKLLGLLTVGKELVTTPLKDNQELKEKTIEIVSRNPDCCWETLAGHLQVDETILKKCREDYSGDTHEVTSQILREWIETSDKNCTLEIIFDALRLCEYKETGIELATYTTEICRIQLHS